MISHEKYTALLSKGILRTITVPELAALQDFEAASPRTCPQCRCQVWSPFLPTRVVHDVVKCALSSVRLKDLKSK